MSNKDGGPAFPVVPVAAPGEWATAYPGMTLRDYFAGQALAGWLAGSLADDSRIVSTTYKTSAELAYMMADAMLRERAKAEGRG